MGKRYTFQSAAASLRLITFAGLCTTLISCQYNWYGFTTIYPALYGPGLRADYFIPTDEVPADLLLTLPEDYQIAYYTGNLRCYADTAGGLEVNVRSPTQTRAVIGTGFLANLRRAQADPDLRVFTPLGYPNTYCVMPAVPIDSLVEADYFLTWLPYLERWQQADSEIDALGATNDELAVANNGLKTSLASVNEQIAFYSRQLDDLTAKQQQLDTQIRDRQIKLGRQPAAGGLSMLSAALSTAAPASQPPPFDLAGKYQIAKDPFVDVIKAQQQDVSGKSWASNQMEGGKYVDSEFARKVDEINGYFADPSTLADKPALRSEVEALKQLGFTGITVTSGTRSPLRQGYLYSDKLKEQNQDTNPVAKYASGTHLIGGAIDIDLPPGFVVRNGNGKINASKTWALKNHQAMRTTLGHLGLNFNVSKDPVHAGLTGLSPNAARNLQTRQMGMMRGYNAKARELAAAQPHTKEAAVFHQGNLKAEQGQLQRDLSNRSDELDQKKSLFQRVSAQYMAKQKELEGLDAEIRHREEEARRQAEAQARRNREHEGHSFERPAPPSREAPHETPPREAPHEAPHERPAREPETGLREGRLT